MIYSTHPIFEFHKALEHVDYNFFIALSPDGNILYSD